jgi:cobalt/nickel transport system permease protein
MGIVGVFVAYAVYTLMLRLFKNKSRGLFVSGFAAAWCSIFIASLSCALQLALSGTSPANIAVPAMAAIHALIGIGEGLITSAALAFIFAARKELLPGAGEKAAAPRGVVLGGLLIALILAVVSPLASSRPDGLEWVAEQKGFLESAKAALFNLIPDYTMPGIANPALATILAAILGTVIVFVIVFGAARVEKRLSARKE